VADLGRAALVTALGLLAYATVAGTFAAWKRRRRLAASAQNALLAAFGAAVAASAVLLIALARHDFSFTYVSQHTSKALPVGCTLTAFWCGQEGSLLLWLLVLCAYAASAVLWTRRVARDLLAWTVPVLGFVGSFFAFMLVFVSSPFATQTAPPDGAGLNPSLQNPYMAIHPPMLYLGYDPGDARNVARLEHAARRARVLSFDLRHVPDAIRSYPVYPLVCGKPARRVVPRVHLHRGHRLDRIDHPAIAAAAREDEARV